MLLLGVGVTLLAISASGDATRAVKAEGNTRRAFAEAKEALIGRAAADDNRPGSLPCPDTDDDGSAELLVGINCPSYLGRLPWRTLGLPDLRDESGERLWYALSPRFRDDNSVQINSDTKGSLTVYSNATAVTLTKAFAAGTPPAGTDAVAVIFAPGLAHSGQARGLTTATCATTGTSIAQSLCAGNYLEAWSGVTNATAPNAGTGLGTYIIAPRGPGFNDALAVLRTAELMPVIERRVATDVTDALQAYFNTGQSGIPADCAQGCYPWPDSRTAGVAGTPPDGTSDTGPNRGRLPLFALPYRWSRYISAITRANPGVITTATAHGFTTGQQIKLSGIGGMAELNNDVVTITVLDATRFAINQNTTLYAPYTSGGTAGRALIHPTTNIAYQMPALPIYFESNNWDRVIYYAVGQNGLQNFGLIPTACTTCTAPPPPLGTLSLNGGSGHAVVMITPGSTNTNRPSTNWADYLDDAGNRDANDTFFTPASKARDRDRLYTIADFAPPLSCGPNAQTLIRNAPCHTTGNNVKPVCQQARNNLTSCPPAPNCSNAAQVMLEPPCRNTLNPGACQTAVATLQSCGS